MAALVKGGDMTTATVDEARLEALMGTLVGYMTGGAVCFAMLLGDELGLYRAMANGGALTAVVVADQPGCNPRLVREWLDGQTSAGLVLLARLLHVRARRRGGDGACRRRRPRVRGQAHERVRLDVPGHRQLKAASRGDGAMSRGEHHPCLFSGTEWFFRTGYRAFLPTEWIPALEGVETKLHAGANVADVGCGHGADTPGAASEEETLRMQADVAK
jgi:hypothetical protein